MKQYTQINLRDRERIYQLKCEKHSIRAIARTIERHPSTISREIKRNSDEIGYLYPGDAEKQTRGRKSKYANKVKRIPGFLEYLIEKLKIHWSPEAIAGRWNNEHKKQTIAAETVYKFIYSKEGIKLGLPRYLARKKKRRGMRRRSQAASTYQEKVSVHQRPNSINNRSESGHFESDLVFHKGSMSHNILTIIERKSRMIFAIKQDSKNSKKTRNNLLATVGTFAKSITFDNGTEFSDFHALNEQGINTFFCDPGAPYQKGAIEHANGMLRRFLPFSLPASTVSQESIQNALAIINNIPRKSLNFLTPVEQFMINYKMNNLSVALRY